MSVMLLLGSGPDVVQCRGWDRADFDRICAINNAWRVRPDWDDLIHPEDFAPGRLPQSWSAGQSRITADAYIPAQNAYGGVVYAGGTMAFTAGYWLLKCHAPKVIAVFGCDMVYPAGAEARTHFYGTGTADPLRRDVTLQSLEAKSARLALLAARQGCAVVNLSSGPSRLLYPRCRPEHARTAQAPLVDGPAVDRALAAEEALGYRVPSGRYWEEAGTMDAAKLAAIDDLWLAAWAASGAGAAATRRRAGG